MYFIGNFVHATDQEQVVEENRRHGEFSMLIHAESALAAVKKFRDRLLSYRQTTDFFQGDCSIFMIQLFEFDMFPVDQAIMFNYKSVAGDPLMPFIRCTLPTDISHTCRIFDWKNNVPQIDGQEEKLFLQFKADAPAAVVEPGSDFRLEQETL